MSSTRRRLVDDEFNGPLPSDLRRKAQEAAEIREAVKMVTGFSDAELTDLGGFTGEAPEPSRIGDYRTCPQCDESAYVTERNAFGGMDKLRMTLSCGHIVLKDPVA